MCTIFSPHQIIAMNFFEQKTFPILIFSFFSHIFLLCVWWPKTLHHIFHFFWVVCESKYNAVESRRKKKFHGFNNIIHNKIFIVSCYFFKCQFEKSSKLVKKFRAPEIAEIFCTIILIQNVPQCINLHK